MLRVLMVVVMYVRFGHTVGQDGPKWEISGTFSDQISVPRQNVLKFYLKKFRIYPTWDQSYQLLAQFRHPCLSFSLTSFLPLISQPIDVDLILASIHPRRHRNVLKITNSEFY